MPDQAKDAAAKAAAAAAGGAAMAKDAVSGIADQHGDKVTGAVSGAAAVINDKTGGKAEPITKPVEDLTAKAVDALKSTPPADPPQS
jgi:hypothetical protein